MDLPEGIKPNRRPLKPVKRPAPRRKPSKNPDATRDFVSYCLGGVAILGLVAAFFLANGTSFLMPGPLSSVHGAIEQCSACHTTTGQSKVSWIKGFVTPAPHRDSEACIACHKMNDNAFNSHSTSTARLNASTKRLTNVAAQISAPQSAKIRDIAFPMQKVMEGKIYCATCHQDHQGADFDLNKISNAQCPVLPCSPV